MNALIKKPIFLLCGILSALCCLLSVTVSAATEVDLAHIDAISDKSIAKTHRQSAKEIIAKSDSTSNAYLPVFVFVDTLLDNYQTLVKDIQDHNVKQNVTIVYLNPNDNGVQKITDTLSHQTDVAAIHLLTHGMAGSIQLGNTALNQNTIDIYTHQLTAWRKSLSANADILIYGCNLTATDAGLQLIKQVGDITQAHIAASKNLTGAVSLGGDWDLESHYGNIKTHVILSAQAQQNWNSTLGYTDYIWINPGTSNSQTFRDNSNVGTSFHQIDATVSSVAIQLRDTGGAATQTITACIRLNWNSSASEKCASMSSTALTTSFKWYVFNFGNFNVSSSNPTPYYIQIWSSGTDSKVAVNYSQSSLWNSSTTFYYNNTSNSSWDMYFALSSGSNDAPTVANTISNQVATVSTAFSFQFASNTFADVNSRDTLTYTATLSSNAALPAWLSFNASTRTFSGTPANGDAGTITVKVVANDGTTTTSTNFNIVVNRVPVVNSAIPDQVAAESTAFSFQFASNAFTDPDSDTLTYTATLSSNAALPAWLSFNAATRTFSGTPANSDIGTISVKVTANDGKGGTVTDTFDIVTSPAVHHYGISFASPGVTCAGSEITITAYNSIGTAIVPTNGTVITLSTTPNTGSWVGGATATFGGVLNNVKKYLQQTTAATLNINVTDGTHTETALIDSDIVFAAAGLTFYGSSGLIAMPNQVAGTTDPNPILKASCSSRVNTGAAISVGMAYECRNPTTCVSGQSFKLANQGVTPNANNAAISYSTGKTLTFDSSGIAPLSLNYNDVGKVRLHARVVLAVDGNDPAITLTGTSSEFVVKPQTLATSAVTTTAGVANPGGTIASGAGAKFVSAGTPFKVSVQARTSGGAITPNFGNETPTENNIRFVVNGLSYPSGGTQTAVTGATSFAVTATPGEFLASSVVWDQVGSFTGQAELADSDYLGAGDLVSKTTSGVIGRFYPDHFVFTSSTANSCVAGGFSFMGQPAITFNYNLQAQGATNTVLTNYGGNYQTATLSYVMENNDSADGANPSYTPARKGTPPAWASGVASVASTTNSFPRQASTAPDGPFESLQFGLAATDSFDLLSLPGLDMDASTTGACSPCNARKIGSALNLRYGRLRLDGASGPETADLKVNFLSEYWNGTHFSLNSNDSCTLVPLSAISYPDGTLATPSHFSVTVGSRSTIGTYANSSGGVHFSAGTAGHSFSAPGVGGVGSFVVAIDLSTLTWLRYDWDKNNVYSDNIPNVPYSFGTYRGNDRIIYWHERL